MTPCARPERKSDQSRHDEDLGRTARASVPDLQPPGSAAFLAVLLAEVRGRRPARWLGSAYAIPGGPADPEARDEMTSQAADENGTVRR